MYTNVRKQKYEVYKVRISKVPMYTDVRTQKYVCKNLWLERSYVLLGTAQQFVLTENIRDWYITEQKDFNLAADEFTICFFLL